ncbi:MAG: flagellar biosynthesis protein [Opitutaceae bacterium]|nr:flagellar biosynthesis protein [Opitutaceae bacterium]
MASTFRKLIAFDRPLSSATIPGLSGRQFSESEVAAARVAGFQEGADSARAFASQQLVDFRAEVQALQDGVFSRLADVDAAVVRQVHALLPNLVMDIVQRLLAGFEPPAEAVDRICSETLSQLYPETENLELMVSPQDAAVLEKISPAWTSRYPGLRITAAPSLSPGDCQVRSRFGITDARLSSKLDTLGREFLAAG